MDTMDSAGYAKFNRGADVPEAEQIYVLSFIPVPLHHAPGPTR